MTQGRVHCSQAEVIVDSLKDLSTDVSPAQRTEGEATLVGQCGSLDPAGLGRLGRRLEELLDPDGVQARDEAKIRDHEARAFGKREFTLSPDPYGSGGLIRGRYDAAGYAVLTAAREALSTPWTHGITGPGGESHSPTRTAIDAAGGCSLTLELGEFRVCFVPCSHADRCRGEPAVGTTRPSPVGLADWNTYGGRMLHLLEPGERVLAFEDIAVIYGWGVPQLPLGPPRSEEPQPWVYAVLTAPLAVAGWSPTMSILHGRTGYGHPSSLAAYFAAATRAVCRSGSCSPCPIIGACVSLRRGTLSRRPPAGGTGCTGLACAWTLRTDRG